MYCRYRCICFPDLYLHFTILLKCVIFTECLAVLLNDLIYFLCPKFLLLNNDETWHSLKRASLKHGELHKSICCGSLQIVTQCLLFNVWLSLNSVFKMYKYECKDTIWWQALKPSISQKYKVRSHIESSSLSATMDKDLLLKWCATNRLDF